MVPVAYQPDEEELARMRNEEEAMRQYQQVGGWDAGELWVRSWGRSCLVHCFQEATPCHKQAL